MLDVPSKKGEKLSFFSSLKKYISQNYSEDPSAYEGDLQILDDIRAKAVNTPDVDNSLKYYAQLQFLGSKFPLNEKAIKLQFSWTHSFNKKKYSSSAINFEKAAVLFNLGAAYCQRAIQQNLKTPEGVKLAFNFFQMAAGAFAMLKDNSPVWFSEPVSSDLSASTASSLELLMLAQAQECFLLKAIADQKSSAVISKLAGQAADLYDQSFDAAKATPSSNGFEGRLDWLTLIQIKALHLNGLAHFHLAPTSLAAMKYGEEIARLDLAMSFLNKAAELSKSAPEFLPSVKDLQTAVQNRLRAANKDNDKIYLELIPPPKNLTPIGRHLMVKTVEITDLTKTSVVGAPLFQKLVPISVHKVAAVYRSRKETYIYEKLSDINRSTNALTSVLVSMNLPAALDALEQPVGLPPGLLVRAEEVRNNGGAASLAATSDHLAQLSKEIEKVLSEGLQLLQKEEAEDNSLRSKYGSRWVRTPSANLNEALKSEAVKHKALLENAAKSDAVVRNKFDLGRPVIEQLGASQQDLEKAVPSSTAKDAFAPPNPHIASMRKLVDEILILKKSNETLADEMKNFVQKDDIVPYLLETYGTKEISDPNAAFEEQLRAYDPFLVRIADNASQEVALTAELQATNEKFQASRATNEFIAKREQVLKQLDAGYAAFQEIRGNQKEGMKFYASMESIAGIYKGKCEDFLMARNTEMQDLLAAVQASLPPPAPKVTEPPGNPYLSHSAPPVQRDPRAEQLRFDPRTGQPLTQASAPVAPVSAQTQAHGFPQGYNPQSYPPGYAPQGFPPQGYSPQGYAPQGYPPQGYNPYYPFPQNPYY